MSSRIAVVTGAARGIGAATARRLAADGMAVAVLDLTEESCAPVVEEITAAGGRALAVGADVSDEAAVTAAIERVVAELGAPTVLVNNAGIIRDDVLHKMSTDSWDAVMNVHLRGAFLTTRAVRPHIVAEKFGRVVNMSSLSAVGNVGQVNYSAAKAGLQGFTKTLALELGRHGATANVVAPGFVESDMTKATADRMGVKFEDFLTAMAGQTAVGRVGTPDDIAAAVSYFCSEEAGFVTGQVLYVAGAPVG